MTDWCVLRMSPGRTIPVVKSLCAAGFDAWTPTVIEASRVGRKRERVERDVPVVPGIAFADYERLVQLVTLSKSPGMIYRVWDVERKCMVMREHPPFGVFRYLDAYPRIADAALDPLRLAERRGKPKMVARTYAPGDRVKYPDAGFDGLTGIVEKTQGQYALVCFPGFSIPIKIAPRFLLDAA